MLRSSSQTENLLMCSLTQDFLKTTALPLSLAAHRSGIDPCPPHLQPTDDFPEWKSRFISTDESGCGQVENFVEVRFIQTIKACRICHGWDKQEKEGRKGDTITRGPGTFGRGREGTKKKQHKKIISTKEVYMDKNQAIIKQKDIKHRTMSYYGRHRRK